MLFLPLFTGSQCCRFCINVTTISFLRLSLQRQRTVYRLTLVKAWNVEEMQAYAELIALGQPDFIEVKVGTSSCFILALFQLFICFELIEHGWIFQMKVNRQLLPGSSSWHFTNWNTWRLTCSLQFQLFILFKSPNTSYRMLWLHLPRSQKDIKPVLFKNIRVVCMQVNLFLPNIMNNWLCQWMTQLLCDWSWAPSLVRG